MNDDIELERRQLELAPKQCDIEREISPGAPGRQYRRDGPSSR